MNTDRILEEDLTQDSSRRRRKGKGRRRRGFEDRYFGQFQCKICHRRWESSFVFTIAGTLKVKYKQRCQKCSEEDAWVFPFDLQCIWCSICDCNPCECVCDDCDGLIHTRFMKDENGKSIEDPKFKYCECERRPRKKIGDKIDAKKPHRSDLCQRCQQGRYCSQRIYKGEEETGNDREP
ncbi:ZAR1-like protein [Aplysia californica]|uniref:ZAR1-like protein n=1 Tax=Aplysia californica TaxID=6500 RepID=A0ABM0K7E9_APLCA|nr:ZAR1-like protein [Aplysia californica]